MPFQQLKAISLKTIDNRFSTSERLHIFTDSSFLDRYLGAGADIFFELFSLYLPLGIFTTAFDAEIEAIAIAVEQLLLRSSEFNRAVIFSHSRSALQALSQNHLCNSGRILKYRLFLKRISGEIVESGASPTHSEKSPIWRVFACCVSELQRYHNTQSRSAKFKIADRKSLKNSILKF
ncbi:uncharacterized protein TNCV_2101801 [Trichonephila clavipes]|nr:uncharacterized protein TNCV_2101801 [Trichonephila clavipes]